MFIIPTEDIHKKAPSREKVLTVQKLVRISILKKYRILTLGKFKEKLQSFIKVG